MQIVRFVPPDAANPAVGILIGQEIRPLPGVDTVSSLLGLSLASLADCCRAASTGRWGLDEVRLLPPVDGRMEVWAAGVTYTVSKAERMSESERAAFVYADVYDAARPELFFKSAAWRVVSDGEPIAIRDDSAIDVPEPELAVVVNRGGEIVGYLVCNDVSSRTIEGENPLYLPQAKVYLGSCAVSAGIRPVWEVVDPYDLQITLRIERDGAACWRGQASTAQLHRRIDELVQYLGHADVFPDGVILSTGTCLVPPLPFTLQPGDVVHMEIDHVGVLRNPVVRGRDKMLWLTSDDHVSRQLQRGQVRWASP